VLEALRARRVYATNGPRIVLDVTLDGAPMGAVLPAGEGKALVVRIAAPGELEGVELVGPAGVLAATPAQGERSLAFEAEAPALDAGDFLYVRVRQRDGGAAWSSPFFFEGSRERSAQRGATERSHDSVLRAQSRLRIARTGSAS
jgi:hypothetical protein